MISFPNLRFFGECGGLGLAYFNWLGAVLKLLLYEKHNFRCLILILLNGFLSLCRKSLLAEVKPNILLY